MKFVNFRKKIYSDLTEIKNIHVHHNFELMTLVLLRFAVVQNKFQQRNKIEINYIIDNHINFEVSLHFLGIWPTVRRTLD